MHKTADRTSAAVLKFLSPTFRITARPAMFERRSIKWPIILGVVMIVLVVVLTVGWVLLAVFGVGGYYYIFTERTLVKRTELKYTLADLHGISKKILISPADLTFERKVPFVQEVVN